MIGITREGHWKLNPEVDNDHTLEACVPERADDVNVIMGQGARLYALTPAGSVSDLGEANIVFPLLHGPWGEDGSLQGLLEMNRAPYAGSGVFGSAAAMDKEHTKTLLHAAGIPVTPHVTIRSRQSGDEANVAQVVQEAVDRLGYPLFVKPARGGSSIGVSRVVNQGQLDRALENARQYDDKVLIEAAIAGCREIECGVLGTAGEVPSASVCGEIRVGEGHDFYDFRAKYAAEERTQIQVPAMLGSVLTRRVQDLSIAAFQAVDCEGLARVDFFLAPDGALYLNELNTMPGFTSMSVFPRLWAATGIGYEALVHRLLEQARQRSARLH